MSRACDRAPTLLKAMGKEPCPSKIHFARCVTQVEGRPDKVTWKCDHCGKHVISGAFRAANARIHLAAEKTNGVCSILCDSTDDHAEGRRQEFRKLIKELERKREEKSRKRKQQLYRLEQRNAKLVSDVEFVKTKRAKLQQPKLEQFLKKNDSTAADVAVAQWALAHDIPPNAMQGPYWRQMNKKLAQVSPSYSPMYPRKIFSDMLPQLKSVTDKELVDHLKHRPTVGRTLTGDGATKQVPLINFLVHVPGKGVKLCEITDCSGHMKEGGVKDAM